MDMPHDSFMIEYFGNVKYMLIILTHMYVGALLIRCILYEFAKNAYFFRLINDYMLDNITYTVYSRRGRRYNK